MEFKGTKQAEKYADGKSSSSVFRDNHIKDYLERYNQALSDSKAPEMLYLLKEIVSSSYVTIRNYELKLKIAKLITESTTI